jgi:hypothetical protein
MFGIGSLSDMDGRSTADAEWSDSFTPSRSLEERDIKKRLESLMEWRIEKGPIEFAPYGFPRDQKKSSISDKTVIKIIGFEQKGEVFAKAPGQKPTLKEMPSQRPSCFSNLAKESRLGLEAIQRICIEKKSTSKEADKKTSHPPLQRVDPLLTVFREEPRDPNLKEGFQRFFKSSNPTESTYSVCDATSCKSVTKGFVPKNK